MPKSTSSFEEAVARGRSAVMSDRQLPLRPLYQEDVDKAWIIDGAKTSSAHVPAATALYGEVSVGGGDAPLYPIGVHKAVGGEGDFPVPGEILCAAIAGCLDSCVRIIANRMGIHLRELEVNVEAGVDVRGTLRFDDSVPVGFQNIQIDVAVEPTDPVPEAHLDALLKGAEHCCIIIQTLRNPPAISVSRSAPKGSELAGQQAAVA